jgi:tetratricopeptide (TPR) repeat protein
MYQFATASNYESIEIRFFFFQIFLFTPLALFGFKKILKIIYPNAKREEKIFIAIIVISIFIPLAFNLVEGHSEINYWSWWYESNDMKAIHDLIKMNPEEVKIIASNYADVSWYKTGVNSVSLPNFIASTENFEEYISYYDISHLIFYEPLDGSYNSELTPEKILNLMPINYMYTEQKFGKSSIMNVLDISEADVSVPFYYIGKMKSLERSGSVFEAQIIRHELRDFNSDKEIELKICEKFTDWDYYYDSIYTCNKILDKDDTNIEALFNLAISYDNTVTHESKNEIIQRLKELKDSNTILIIYDRLIREDYHDIEVFERENQNELIFAKEKVIFINMMEKADLLRELGEYNEAFTIYLEMLSINKFNPILYEKIADYLVERGQISQAIHNYELASKFDPDNEYLLEKIEEHR